MTDPSTCNRILWLLWPTCWLPWLFLHATSYDLFPSIPNCDLHISVLTGRLSCWALSCPCPGYLPLGMTSIYLYLLADCLVELSHVLARGTCPLVWPLYICTYWQIVLLSSLMSLPGGTCPFVRSIMTSTVATFRCSSEHFSRASSNFWRHSLGGRPGPTKGWPVPGKTGGYRILMCYDHECTECNKLNTLLLAQKDKVNDTDCNNKECSKKKKPFFTYINNDDKQIMFPTIQI